MRVYWLTLQQTLRRELAYPARNWVDFVGDGMRVLFWAALWGGLYAINGPPGGEDVPLKMMLTYSVVAIMMRGLVDSHVAASIRTKVRTGAIATDLLKPVSLPAMIVAESGGRFLWRAVQTAAVVGAVVWPLGLHLPQNAPLFLLSVALGWSVSLALSFAMHTIAFWTLESRGILMSVRYLGHLLSGSVVPVWFFPDWMERVATALPFPAMYHYPMTIYLGRVTGAEALLLILTQATWVALLAAAGTLLWRRGLRKVVVQGG